MKNSLFTNTYSTFNTVTLIGTEDKCQNLPYGAMQFFIRKIVELEISASILYATWSQ
jgi:hypothetical protein